MRILNSPVSVGTNKYITYDHVRLRVDFCEQWGGGGEHKGIRWIKWGTLCDVKEVGGLEFHKLQEFNVAMLTKQDGG